MAEGIRVVNEEWDWLIILDACRYDYFKRLYSDYFNGKLEKRRSLASNTQNWLARNFVDYYDDIEYISANPYINRENIPLHKLTKYPEKKELKNWYPKHRFRRIHDLSVNNWFDGGSNKVEPEEVVDFCLNKKFFADTRKIIHFIQPHRPYLDAYSFNKFNWFIREIYKKVKNEEIQNLFLRAFYKMFGNIWYKEHQKKYKHNLKRVLSTLPPLTESLEGKIIISADHGQCLGEYNTVGHPGKNYDVLREIPWFIVEK